MKTITFHCQTITPMFLAGADGKTPELRPPSIKGAMRFWWRAMNGHLDLKALKEREGDIFGNNEKRSKVVLGIENKGTINTHSQKPIHYKNYSTDAIAKNQSFDLKTTLYPNHFLDEQKFVSFITLFFLLGGAGKRQRRGFGSIKICSSNSSCFKKMPETYNEIIYEFKKTGLEKYFYLGKKQNDQECIYSKFMRNESYPYIKQIEVGRVQNNIPTKTANVAHDLKEKDFKQGTKNYGVSLGQAVGGRFASPVYVSAIQTNKGIAPVITTLNTVPEKFRQQISKPFQEEFINKIL